MKQWQEKSDLANDQRLLRDQLADRAKVLTGSEAKMVLKFIDELVVCYDPDVIHDFLQWREDPRLASLLQLGARLSDDMRDQLLFEAEDLFASEQTRQ